MLNEELKQHIERLIKEEDDAIHSYEKTITFCEDTYVIEILKHIIAEEIEHKQELENLLNEPNDSEVLDNVIRVINLK